MSKKMTALAAASSLLITIAGPISAASAAENPSVEDAIKQTQVQQGATQTSVAPVSNQSGGVSTRSADGITIAPGGNGAYVSMNVRGQGLHVDSVYVNYFPGTDIAGSNASAEEFELAWYESGERRAETKGPDSGLVRATQSWDFNRDIDAGPMCGRVKISGAWSNYACVEIKP